MTDKTPDELKQVPPSLRVAESQLSDSEPIQADTNGFDGADTSGSETAVLSMGTENSAVIVRKNPLEGGPEGIVANHYQISELIGKGGMSSVYKAQHVHMKRTVAIKILHKHLLENPKTIKRFQNESEAAARLEHKNVAKIYEFTLDENHNPFLIMEFLQGKSLAEVVSSQGRMTPDRVVKIMLQTCDALSAAHASGIIHRDVKPSNFMLVTEDGNRDTVKLVDFGIAKIIRDNAEDTQGLTQTGEIFGSPFYMSPEQCRGEELDARSDIYSLGCVIFEALTGQPPFRGSNAFMTFEKQLNEAPPTIRKFRPDIENIDQLDGIILKCLAKNPAHRYQTVEDLKVAITRYAKRERDGSAGKRYEDAAKTSTKSTKPDDLMGAKIILGILVLICIVVYSAVMRDSFSTAKDGAALQSYTQRHSKGKELSAGEKTERQIKHRLLNVLKKLRQE